jgi:YesN/AraC family two-component response regulator
MSADEMLKNLKILYAEDDGEAREELTDVLKRRVGRVFACDNGVRGLELYNDHKPDIIIADYYMPEMDGIEMINRIHKQDENIAAIVISAVSDVSTILSAIDAGIYKYILKPVNVQELLDVLGELAGELYEKRKQRSAALPENRKKVEDEIKREFSAMLKATTGKGPRNVSVFMNGTDIEITASEVLTVFEKNLLDNNRNAAVIKYIREMFFSVKEKEICSMIMKISGYETALSKVIINPERDKNKLIFTIRQG